MVKMDYLLKGGDIHKYDNVQSKRIWGEHPVQPKYTIMIPTYKRPDFLRQSLSSALAQKDFTNFEVVIVDNNAEGAMDNETLQVVKDFASDKVVYYKNEENIGIYGNTLRAAQLAHGKYVVLLNDDDLLNPYYLCVVDAFVKKYNYKGIVGARPFEFRGEDAVFPPIEKKIYSFKVSKKEFFFGCTVTSPGLMYPKKILEEIYNAHESLLMGDQIIQYKALEKYGLIFIGFPLAAYRISDNATLKDDVLKDMIFHMCGFRYQTAKRDVGLNIFMKVFGKEYCYWYMDSSLYFWKKRMLRKELIERLGLKNVNKWSLKMLFLSELIEKINKYYSKNRNYDYIEMEN